MHGALIPTRPPYRRQMRTQVAAARRGGPRPWCWVSEDRPAVCNVAAKAKGGAALAGSARDVQDGVGVLEGPGQHADRLCCGKDDQFDLATAGLFPDLLHHRQPAISTGANH